LSSSASASSSDPAEEKINTSQGNVSYRSHYFSSALPCSMPNL
jgi:hypothetical protein